VTWSFLQSPPEPEPIGPVAVVDPELLTGARLLTGGSWRAAHEAFESAWRRTEGEPRPLFQALAQLAAALLKWSDGRREPAATLLGRVRGRLEGLPSRVSRVEVDALESAVLELEERLQHGDPAPERFHLPLDGRRPVPVDRVGLGAVCPYCGEQVMVHVESTGVSIEAYVEDCPVCCRPWEVRVGQDDGRVNVELSRDDD